MGMAEVFLKWPLRDEDGHERQLVIRRSLGVLADTLIVEVEGEPILKCPAGSADTHRSHQFSVSGVEYVIRWKWSKATGDPESIELLRESETLYSYEGDRTEDHYSTDTSQGRRNILVSAILIILVAVATATNPSHDDHKQAIRNRIGKDVPVASALGLGRLHAWGSDYHSLVVISWTTHDGRVDTVGAFGVAFAFRRYKF